MPEMRFRLEPAVYAPPHLRPAIPAWWPVEGVERRDDAGNVLPPMTQEERSRVRVEFAHDKARQGPRDGVTGTITYGKAGPPAFYEPDPGYRYTLSRRLGGVLIYRYDPEGSTQHHAQMMAVEQAFQEYGVGYARQAQHEGAVAG